VLLDDVVLTGSSLDHIHFLLIAVVSIPARVLIYCVLCGLNWAASEGV
jgi:hypothetical protein